MTESDMKFYEAQEIENGSKMMRFHGRNKKELEDRLWKFVNNNNIDIKFLVCRKFRYNVYY